MNGGIVFTVMPLRRVLRGERLGQPDHARLRRRVVPLAGRGGLPGSRGDRDDPPPPGRDHVADRRLHTVKRAGQVDRQRAIPVVERDLLERHKTGHGGARDKDLDRAELGPHQRVRLLDRGPVRHVDLARRALDAPRCAASPRLPRHPHRRGRAQRLGSPHGRGACRSTSPSPKRHPSPRRLGSPHCSVHVSLSSIR